MSTRQIMKIMVNQFWKKVTPEMIKRAGELGFNTHQFVTFASIIGKESGDDAEKPMISAVFHNRLKRKCAYKAIRRPFMIWIILTAKSCAVI
jgi:UPF0755 protein